MEREKVIQMVYSKDHELAKLGMILLVNQFTQVSEYETIKRIIVKFPHKEGRKELRRMAQKKHLKNLEDARRIAQDL